MRWEGIQMSSGFFFFSFHVAVYASCECKLLAVLLDFRTQMS